MGQPFVGEVRLFGGNFAINGWQFCDGTLLQIAEFDTLFNLIGTTYGGDGQSTFAVPDLRGRTPIHIGSNGASAYVLGQTGGVETVTIVANTYPQHTHSLFASTNSGGSNDPNNAVLGNNQPIYSTLVPATAMNANMVGFSGGGNQPHDNLQPYLALNWIISLFGIFPSQG